MTLLFLPILACVLLLSPWGVQELLRPLAAGIMARTLRAEVAIGALRLSASGLSVSHLSVARATDYTIDVDEIGLEYSLSNLLQRQVDGCRISSPAVTLNLDSPEPDTGPSGPVRLPEELPLTLRRLDLKDGKLRVLKGSKSFDLDRIEIASMFDEAARFRVSTRIGGRPESILTVSGKTAWKGQPVLLLEQARYSGENLLAEPFRLTWSPEEQTGGRGRIGMAKVDDRMVNSLFRGLNLESPVPEGTHFEFLQMKAAIRISEEGSSFQTEIAQARVCKGPSCVSFENAHLNVLGSANEWDWEGWTTFAGQGTLRVTAASDASGSTLEFQASIPEFSASVSRMLGQDVPRLRGGLDVAGRCTVDPQRYVRCTARMKGLDHHPAPDRYVLSLAPLGSEFSFEWQKERWSGGGRIDISGYSLIHVTAKPDRIGWTLSLDSGQTLSSFTGPGFIPGFIDGVHAVRGSGTVRMRTDGSYSSESTVSVGTWNTGVGTLEDCRLSATVENSAKEGTTLEVSGSIGAISESEPVLVAGGMDSKSRCRFPRTGPSTCSSDIWGTYASSPPVRSTSYVKLEPLRLHVDTRRSDGTWGGEARLLIQEIPVIAAGGDLSELHWNLTLDRIDDIQKLVEGELLPEWLQSIEQVRGSGQVRIGPDGTLAGDTRVTAAGVQTQWAAFEKVEAALNMARTKRDLEFSRMDLSAVISGDGIPSGTYTSTGSAVLKSDGAFRLIFDSLRGEGMEFLSADGLSGMGGGSFEVEGTVSRDTSDGSILTHLTGHAGVGEVLLGKFYADLSPVASTFSLNSRLMPDARRLELEDAELILTDIGNLSLLGSLSPAALDLRADVSVEDSSTLMKILAPALQEFSPVLATAEASGRLALHLHLVGTGEAYRLDGSLRPRDLSFSAFDLGVNVAGMAGSVPFHLLQGARVDKGPDTEDEGSIAFSDFSVGPLRLISGDIRLASRTNSIRLASPVRFSLAGGEAGADFLSIQRQASGLGIEAHGRIQEVDLETLTNELGLPPMRGRITADLGTVRYVDNMLASDGEAKIQAFKGDFTVKNLYMNNPFSRFRTIHGDLDFSGIDLHELSQTFEFGEMNGVLDGYIHNLRLFEATPSRFTARLETRERGKRDISVKALNNLSILSQGGITAALSHGVYRFVDFYRYKKIGIVCELENDVFTLTGNAREGSDRYLVYGALLPPRIDIIAPGHRISFKEMLKRVKRVERKRS